MAQLLCIKHYSFPKHDVVENSDVDAGDVSVAVEVAAVDECAVVAVKHIVVEGCDINTCHVAVAIDVAIDYLVGLENSQQTALGVIATVDKCQVAGLWCAVVAEDDTRGLILAAGGPA